MACAQRPVGAADLSDYDSQTLRDLVHVIDGSEYPECSIAEFLSIADPTLSRAAMRQLLHEVGLVTDSPTVAVDLDRIITPGGYPLSVAGIVKLKIAYALASNPRVLVLTPLFDVLSHESRELVMETLRRRLTQATIVCFSHRHDTRAFDRFSFWNYAEQVSCSDAQTMAAAFDAAIETAVGESAA